jgi:electron transport complex protein RnfE
MKTNEIIKNGLWYNNPAIMQLLGLCPLLAVSNTLISAIALGLATILVLTLSNTIISLIKNYIDYNLRIPFFMLVIASIVTCLILIMQSYSYSLYQSLGVYLALITTNCVILGRIEAFAYKNNVLKSALDGLSNGLGFSLVLIILGSIREILGQGTLFANANLLFGEYGNNLILHFNNTNNNFIIALLPPGAFFILGLLIATKNYINIINDRTSSEINEQRTNISNIPKISAKKC